MLIAMAVWDTVENQRTQQTNLTLRSLAKRVDWSKHRLFVCDNGSCEATQVLYMVAREWLPFYLIKNGENLGTARAINRGWSYRKPGEHVVKMDNDVVVNYTGWADEMAEAFERDPSLGICGLKRKDLEERPDNPVPHYQSTLRMLPHQPGQRWIVVEDANHILGTCQGYSDGLLNRIGYLYQGDWKYGFDDALASLRAHVVGFKTSFLPHIDLDHVDPGGNDYTRQKAIDAGCAMQKYGEIVLAYRMGQKQAFYNGGDDALWAETHPLVAQGAI